MADSHVEVAPVGRQRELDRVRGWVADLTAGRGRAVLVEGEPGIGKSSLVRAAALDAISTGCHVVWATCDELSQAFPLFPLLDALDNKSTGTPAAARPGRRVTDVMRADSPANGVDLVAAGTERLLTIVDDMCSSTPLMLVVDDLQWADPPTVVAVGRLARSVHQIPLLLVGMARQVPKRDDLSALRRAVDPVLSLDNLSDDEVAELVECAVGGAPGPGLLRLAEGAAGNPLYLTELLDALIRGGRLTPIDGKVEVIGREPPESLTAVIAERLEFLAAPVRELLRVAALLGVDFSVSELAVVSGHRVNELLPVIDEAIAAGMLLDNGAELSFRHALVRTALYEAMPTAVRAAWHRDAARDLAEDGSAADRVARQLLPTVDAYDGGGSVDEWAIRWLTDSGQQLVGQAPRAAVRLLRWAVTGIPAGVPPHDVLSCRLADALYRVGDARGAADVAAGALIYVTRPDLLVDLHWTLAQCRARDGRSEESLATLERALHSPGVGPQHRARLKVLIARAYRSLGRVDTANQVADEALAAAIAAGDRWATAWALFVLTILYGSRGEVDKALPLIERALAVAEGDPALTDLRLLLQINQAAALGDLDRYDDAISAAEQVRQLADDAGNVMRLAQAQSVLGELLFDVGRWDDALAEVDVPPAGPEDPTVECSDHGVAATIQLHRGDAEAGRHIADAERYAERLGDRIIGSLALAKSLQREQADEPVQALAVLMEGLSEPVEEAEESADLLADAVRLAVTVGDKMAAGTLMQRAEIVSQATNVPHRKAVAPHCRGLLYGDPALLLKAADHYKTAGRLLPRAQALEAAGVALAERGDIAEARSRFTDAFSLYTTLGAGWDLARTQARFRAYGIRRGPRVRHRSSSSGWDSLTPTELKVVALVAQGLSNPQIAAQLFLSRRTVQTHVSHILSKLDLHSRIDIAREASRREMTESATDTTD